MTPLPNATSINVRITQLQAARAQLDRAIILLLTECDYVSAVTLACASEGITGEYLSDRNIKTHVKKLKEFAMLNIFPNLNEKAINDHHINYARNFFKHKICAVDEQIEFNLENETIGAICRAADNLITLTESPSEKLTEFWRWLKVHRPDLINNASSGTA